MDCRFLKARHRSKYAAKPSKERRRKGDRNSVCDRQQARTDPLKNFKLSDGEPVKNLVIVMNSRRKSLSQKRYSNSYIVPFPYMFILVEIKSTIINFNHFSTVHFSQNW